MALGSILGNLLTNQSGPGSGLIGNFSNILALIAQGQQAQGARDFGTWNPENKENAVSWNDQGVSNVNAINDANPSYRSSMEDAINQWASRDPGALFQLEQYDLNKQARDYGIQRANEIENLYRNSAVPGIADKLGNFRDSWLNTGNQRMQDFSARGTADQGRINALGEDVTTKANALYNNADAKPEDIAKIVGQLVGNSNDVYAQRSAAAGRDAAARGLSPGAAFGAQTGLAGQSIRSNQDLAANVALQNFNNAARIRQAALDSLSGVGDIYTNGAGVAQGWEGLGNQIYGQQGALAPDMYTKEAGLRGIYEGNLANAIQGTVDANQPLDVSSLGSMIDQSRLAQYLREQGANQEMINLLTGYGAGQNELSQADIQRHWQEHQNTLAREIEWARLGMAAADPIFQGLSGSGFGGGTSSPKSWSPSSMPSWMGYGKGMAPSQIGI